MAMSALHGKGPFARKIENQLVGGAMLREEDWRR